MTGAGGMEGRSRHRLQQEKEGWEGAQAPCPPTECPVVVPSQLWACPHPAGPGKGLGPALPRAVPPAGHCPLAPSGRPVPGPMAAAVPSPPSFPATAK